MPSAYILRGLPGCGKSTFATNLLSRKRGLQVICRDDIRAAFGVNGHDSNSYNPEMEHAVSFVADTMLEAVCERGLHVVLDETHTTIGSINKSLAILKPHLYRVFIVEFRVTVKVCMERRPKIPAEVYQRMAGNLISSNAELGRLYRSGQCEPLDWEECYA